MKGLHWPRHAKDELKILKLRETAESQRTNKQQEALYQVDLSLEPRTVGYR